MAYDRLADSIIRHAKLIVALWVVILLVAAVPAVKAFGEMSYDMTDMGLDDSESMQGYEVLAEYFPSSSSGDASSFPLIVLQYDGNDEHEAARALADLLLEESVQGDISDVVGEGSDLLFPDSEGNRKISLIVEYADTSDSNPQEDGSGIIMLAVMYADGWESSDIIEDTSELRSQIDAFVADVGIEGVNSLGIYLTGVPAISHDMEVGATEDISHIDVFTVLMVLILVGLFFRSFITSTTPPITIGVAFIVTMGIMFGLTYIMDIFFITEMMLIVSMMGAGCDYCIFVIARYREELRDGKDHHDALHGAIKWAGESITISAASVIIGFGAMSICSFSMISTMGICLAIGILIALMAALTLIPSILAVIGDRIFWPTRIKEYREGGKATRGWFAWSSRVGHKYFDKSSRFTLKHAKAIVVVAVLVTLPAAYVTMTSETSYDMSSSLMTGDSEEGMEMIGEYADQGLIYPNYVIMQYDEPIATVTQAIDPLTGDLLEGSYTLTWSPGWELTGEKYASLTSLMGDIVDGDPNDNISYVTGLYRWESSVNAAFDALGMSDWRTNPSVLLTGSGDALSYIIANTPSTQGLILAETTTVMQIQYRMYIIAGAFDSIASEMFGIPSLSQMFAGLPEDTQDNIVCALMLLGGAGTIDYVMNAQSQIIGGDFVSSADGTGAVTYVKLTSATHDAAMSHTSMDSISYMEGVVKGFASDPANGVAATWITGSAVIMFDVSDIISGEFTNIEILVIVLIIILLLFVMKSYTIPFRSVLTILMSICWTLAATHLIFGDEVTWLIPLILLVICLGLGMDYDILLTTRIKENVRANGMTNDEAIHHAVIHSGSVITICGLIMGGAFGTLMLSSMGMLQQFGFALCFAILCDALIVRTYIVPAVMHLLGDWNWKGPKFLDRIGSGRKDAESAEDAE